MTDIYAQRDYLLRFSPFCGQLREQSRGAEQSHRCGAAQCRPCLVLKFTSKFYYVKRRFLITSKYRHMYGVLNVDKIKN
jgi:hypothetical protein